MSAAISLAATLERLRAARSPAAIFGDVDIERGKELYHQLAKALHPDRHSEADRDAAKEAMTILNRWWDSFKHTSAGHDSGPVVISAGRVSYEITAPIAAGEVADLHWAVRNDGKNVVLKIAREVAGSALMANEVSVLTALTTAPVDLKTTFPDLLGTFKLDGRTAHVTDATPSLVSMQSIMDAFPGGIDARDAIWMWKRALGAVGLAHSVGHCHGAMLPNHVLLDLTSHGCHLVGWTFSARIGGRIRAKILEYADFYPSDAPTASVGLDLFMLARSVATLTASATLPVGLRRLLDMCLGELGRRPKDAWSFHEIVDLATRETFGPPKFRPFMFPANGVG